MTTATQKPTALAIARDKGAPLDTRVDSIRKVMLANSGKLARGIAGLLTPDRMIQVACNSIRKNPKLLDCSPQSLFGAISEAATYGWTCDGITGQASLVPFGDQVVLVPGYKGLRDLVRRSGDCVLTMESVHEGDEYEFNGRWELPTHNYSKDPSRRFKPVTFAYVVGKFRDGQILAFSWSVGECIAHRDHYSQSWRRVASNPSKAKESPWCESNPSFRVMCMKTVLLDAIHRGEFPLSVEARQIARREVEIATVEAQTIDNSGIDAFEHLALPDERDDESTVDGQVVEADDDDADHSPRPLDGLAEALEAATTIGQVNKVAEEFEFEVSQANLTNAEAAIAKEVIKDQAKKKVEEIRGNRGERSNKKAAAAG